MLEKINKILSKLPFNGKKTGIGIALALIAILLPDFPISETQINEVVQAFGSAYAIIGVLHKYIKAKLK